MTALDINPLAAISVPPHGVVASVDHAAFNAAFPGLPAGMTAGEARRRVRAAVEAVEPLIVKDCIDRIVRSADVTERWGVRIRWDDGTVDDSWRDDQETAAREVAAHRAGGWDRSWVIRRHVLTLPAEEVES